MIKLKVRFIHSYNANKTKATIVAYREETNYENPIWLEIRVNNMANDAHAQFNPFAFSDGTVLYDSDFAFKWYKNKPNYDEGDQKKCVLITKDLTLYADECSVPGKPLCKIVEKCEDEISTNSKSDRSRVHSPVFALFLAISVLKFFFAQVGSVV